MKKRYVVLLLIIVAVISRGCGSSKGTTPEPETSVKSEVSDLLTEDAPSAEEVEEAPAETPVQEAQEEQAKETAPEQQEAQESDTVTPEFKATMDAYEAFFDEYVDYTKKYLNADSTAQLSMLADYTTLLAKYATMAEELDKIDENELSTADYIYYIEVTARIEKKMLELS